MSEKVQKPVPYHSQESIDGVLMKSVLDDRLWWWHNDQLQVADSDYGEDIVKILNDSGKFGKATYDEDKGEIHFCPQVKLADPDGFKIAYVDIKHEILLEKDGSIFKVDRASDMSLASKIMRVKLKMKALLDDGWDIKIRTTRTTTESKTFYLTH